MKLTQKRILKRKIQGQFTQCVKKHPFWYPMASLTVDHIHVDSKIPPSLN